MRIFLIGFMGCGKTHWGQLLSQKLRIPFYDLDSVIEEQEERPVTDIFSEMGEEHFRLLEKEALYLLTEIHPNFVMACGGGAPCFFNNIDYMNKRGTTVWIHCTTDTLYSRLVKERESRPLVKNIPDADLRSFIIKRYADRKIFYQQAAIVVNEEELTVDTLISKTFHA